MPVNRFAHPLATPTWELAPASPVRLHTRASWDSPPGGEPGAPERRILHSRALFTDTPATLHRVSVGAAAGYHKCASGQERDGIVELSLHVPDGGDWREVGRIRSDAQTVLGEGAALDLDGLRTTSLVARAHRAITDEWWPGWNLVSTGIQLEADIDPDWHPGREGRLETVECSLKGLPSGVEAWVSQSEVRYRTASLEVGFRLISPAWSHLAVDSDHEGRTGANLLQLPRSMDIVRSGVYPSGVYPVLRDQNAEYLAQGPRFTATDGCMPLGFLHSDYRGSTSIRGNTVRYEIESDPAGQRYILEFRVERDRMLLRASRVAQRTRRAWHSSAWHVACDNRVTPSTVLGAATHVGEAGLLEGPVAWHFPRHGTFRIHGDGALLWRSDSVRPLDTNTLELKLGETATPFGDYLLPAGRYDAEIEFVVDTPRLARLQRDTPPSVRRALDRHAITALSYRPDTDTYSNNGASMHCTTSLNDVSAIAEQLDDAPGIAPMTWVRDSLQRWLDGAPSYGSGATSQGSHRLEDEYVQLAANTLVGAARYSAHDAEWFLRNRERLTGELEQMLARDVDGDGLVESTIRLGNSGEHQWSTSWSDVLSFGWKDAWANAVLYEAWRLWIPVLRASSEHDLADRIGEAARRMQGSYLPMFLNESTGLVAGWRSKDGMLHDYGFSLVNGAACMSDLLPLDDARNIMESLARAWEEAGLRDFRNGIPLNLWRIPEEDIGGVVFGLPMGSYQQGGHSHHGTRVIVDALHRVRMTALADSVLEQLTATIADDSAFGGLGSGLDWRMADGTPSGYEGQLVEGFSVLASALRRYRAATPRR